MNVPVCVRLAAAAALLALLSPLPLSAQFGPGDIDGACSCVPGLNDLQQTEVTRIEEAAEVQIARVTAAQKALLTAVLSDARDDARIRAAVAVLAAAEFDAAVARADAFARMQAGTHRLSPAQVAELIQFRARGGPAGRGGPGMQRGGGGAGRGQAGP
jgi:hypothetical protein